MNPKHLLIAIFFICAVLCSQTLFSQQDTTKSALKDTLKIKEPASSKKEEANRNVMLNAESNAGPRFIQIGIPTGSAVDVPTILENDMPAVYYFFPRNPNTFWRAGSGYANIGVLKISEVAITTGRVGYGVNSYTRKGQDKFAGLVNYGVNHFGMQRFDMNVSGKLAKDLNYSASVYQMFDPGSAKLPYSELQDRSAIYTGTLTKYFNDRKGELSLTYRRANSYSLSFLSSYTPFIYNGDGSISELPGMPLGTTNISPVDGTVAYKDMLTGEMKNTTYKDAAKTQVNQAMATFNYKYDNGLKLKVNAMYSNSDAGLVLNLPTSIITAANVQSSAAIYTYPGTTNTYTGDVLNRLALLDRASARMTAEWANKLQALSESSGLGIPAIIASNPRNHITKDASIGLSVGKTAFSTWPGELGLSAMRDLKLTREFADIARQEWAAVGLRKGYMYMADLATEPRWQRIEGTFGEDAKWVAKIMTEITLGFQGKKLSPSSVALTTKHFPGGGAAEGGQDPHFDWGKKEIFPGKMLKNNLIPFKAAIKAGTSSIMPYYSIPIDTEYEEIAYAYNKGVIQDLLRGKMGFKGIINSDTGPIEMMPWGAEHLTIAERYKKTLEAGVNIYSGTADPSKLLEVAKSGAVDLKLIDNSVFRLLMEKFELGLFENPYVDEDAAEKIVGNAKFQEKADLAFRKSIVLLRNEKKSLPLKAKTKVYFESYFQKKGDSNASKVYKASNNNYALEFVNTPEEADVVLLWIAPGSKNLFDSDGSPFFLSLSKNAVNVDYINKLIAKKPTILAINYTNPWVIDEIYNKDTKNNINGVIATFGTSPEALLDIVSGKFNPQGKMPFSTPISEDAAQNQLSDVPGYLEGKGYPLFNNKEGLTY